MADLRKMSYGDFGKLRFLDFFPKVKKACRYYSDKSGGMECAIGLADYEGYGPAAGFISKCGETGEIELEFYNGCPELESHNLFDSLSLGIRKGMRGVEIKRLLGKPEQDDLEWPRFILGKKWRYY